MKRQLRRLIRRSTALMLALCMVLTMNGFTAFAQQTKNDAINEKDAVSENGAIIENASKAEISAETEGDESEITDGEEGDSNSGDEKVEGEDPNVDGEDGDDNGDSDGDESWNEGESEKIVDHIEAYYENEMDEPLQIVQYSMPNISHEIYRKAGIKVRVFLSDAKKDDEEDEISSETEDGEGLEDSEESEEEEFGDEQESFVIDFNPESTGENGKVVYQYISKDDYSESPVEGELSVSMKNVDLGKVDDPESEERQELEITFADKKTTLPVYIVGGSKYGYSKMTVTTPQIAFPVSDGEGERESYSELVVVMTKGTGKRTQTVIKRLRPVYYGDNLKTEYVAINEDSSSTLEDMLFRIDWGDTDVTTPGNYAAKLYWGLEDENNPIESADLDVLIADRPEVEEAYIELDDQDRVFYKGVSNQLNSMRHKTLHIKWKGVEEECVIKNKKSWEDSVFGMFGVKFYIKMNDDSETPDENWEEGDDEENFLTTTENLEVGTYDVTIALTASGVNAKEIGTYQIEIINPPVSKITWDNSSDLYTKKHLAGQDFCYHYVWTSQDIKVTLENGFEATMNQFMGMDDMPEYADIAGSAVYYYIDPDGEIGGRGDSDMTIYNCKPGTYTLCVEMGDAKGTATFDVQPNLIEGIEIVKMPDKTEYYEYDENVNLKGMQFRLVYTDGSKSERIYGDGKAYTGYITQLGEGTYENNYSNVFEEDGNYIIIYDEKQKEHLVLNCDRNIRNYWVQDDEQNESTEGESSEEGKESDNDEESEEDESDEEWDEPQQRFVVGQSNIMFGIAGAMTEIPITFAESPYASMKVTKIPDSANQIGLSVGEFEINEPYGMKLVLTDKSGKESTFEVTRETLVDNNVLYGNYFEMSNDDENKSHYTVSWRGLTANYDTQIAGVDGSQGVTKMELGKLYPVKANSEKRYRIFSFTPDETKTYYFNSNSSEYDEPTAVLLEDDMQTPIKGASGCDWIDNSEIPYEFSVYDLKDYLIEAELEADNTYYLLTSTDEWKNYTVRVTDEYDFEDEILLDTVDLTVSNPSVEKPFYWDFDNYLSQKEILNAQDGYGIELRWNGEEFYDEVVGKDSWRFNYGMEPEVRIELTPFRGFKFSALTNVKINGKRATSRKILADGRIEIIYKAPKLNYLVSFPEDERESYSIDVAKRNMEVSEGQNVDFSVTLANKDDLDSLVVKASGTTLVPTYTNPTNGKATFKLEDVQSNKQVVVLVKKSNTPVSKSDVKVTFMNKEEVCDEIVLQKGSSIASTDEEYLPVLKSYVAGSDQFFVGWFLSKDENGNGCGTQFTNETEIKQNQTVYAKFIKGIFAYEFEDTSLNYKVVSIQDNGTFNVEITNEIPKVDSENREISNEEGVATPNVSKDVIVPGNIKIADDSFKVVSVAKNAFANAKTEGDKNITSIVLPDTVTKVADGAFANCDKLEEIAFPDSIAEFPKKLMGESDATDGSLSIVCSPELYEDQKERIDAAGSAKQILIQSAHDEYEVHYDNAVDIYASTLVGDDEFPIQWSWNPDDEEYADFVVSEEGYITIGLKDNANCDELKVEAQYVEAGKVVQTKSIKVIVIKNELDEELLEVEEIARQTYAGNPVEPKLEVKYDGEVWVEGVNYTLSYENNIKPGIGIAIVRPMGTYGGEYAYEFQILGIPVDAISFEEAEYEMEIGDEALMLEPVVLPENAYNPAINWKSSDTDVAIVDEQGLVHAKAVGETTITAITLSGLKKAEVAVSVKAKQQVDPGDEPGKDDVKVTDVSLNKSELKMTVGDESVSLVATVTPDNATNKKITWNSSNDKVATVSDKGEVTPVAAGTTVILVITEDGEKTASCTVTVEEKKETNPGTGDSGDNGNTGDAGNTTGDNGNTGNTSDDKKDDNSSNKPETKPDDKPEVKPDDKPVTVPVTALSVSHKKLTLAKGRKFKLEITRAPFDTTDEITYTSSNPSFVSVNDKGEVKALKAGKSAIITIKATSGKTVTCKVTVPKKEVKATKITLNKKSVTIKKGKTFKLKAKMNPKKTTDNVFYSTKNKKVAIVSNTGVITAVKKGKTTITAKTTSGKKATITVIIK